MDWENILNNTPVNIDEQRNVFTIMLSIGMSQVLAEPEPRIPSSLVFCAFAELSLRWDGQLLTVFGNYLTRFWRGGDERAGGKGGRRRERPAYELHLPQMHSVSQSPKIYRLQLGTAHILSALVISIPSNHPVSETFILRSGTRLKNSCAPFYWHLVILYKSQCSGPNDT
jgi:hypothetical protein